MKIDKIEMVNIEDLSLEINTVKEHPDWQVEQIASLIAYILAQINDVFIFHKLKEINKGKHKWLRNNLSTICSQFIDTSIFITIAFYGVVPNLVVVIYSQFLIKVILALIDTPFFYLFTCKGDINSKE